MQRIVWREHTVLVENTNQKTPVMAWRVMVGW